MKTLLKYVPARLTSVEAGRRLGMLRMDVYEPLLCYPQKFEKLRMLSGLRRDSKDVRTHFLSGLDREVRIMFTGRFPTWLENGNLDAGYAYVSELQETFNTVTRDIPRYSKYHQSMDEAISAEYGDTSNARRGPANPATNAGRFGGNGDSHLRAGSSAAAGSRSDSRRSLGGGRDQRRWPRNEERRDRGSQHYRGSTATVNVRRTEVAEDDPADDATEAADATADSDPDWSGNESWPDEDIIAQRVEMMDADDADDSSVDLAVRMAAVVTPTTAPAYAHEDVQPRVTHGHVIGSPPAEERLLDPWRIPVRASAGGPEIETWAELDSGASHTLVSETLARQLKPRIEAKQGSIHLAMKSMSVKRVGQFDLVLRTTRHRITVKADVLPGECGSPILVGRDVLARHRVEDLLSVLLDRDGEQLATTTEPDVAELEAADDSAHRSDMMAALTSELTANTSLDESLACPLPEAVVTIPTTGSRKVFRSQPRFGEADSAKVDALVADLQARGFIRPAPPNCPYNSLIFLVPKKDAQGKLTASRPVVDYRWLNAVTDDDVFPLPRVRDIIKDVAGATVFTTLDLTQAYHRFPVAADDQPKTAFSWNREHWVYVRAPFGLKNLPAQFQRVIARLLRHCPFARAYIDDIVVFSGSMADHLEHVRLVVRKLTDARLVLNVDKCRFGLPAVRLLGFIVSGSGHAAEPERLEVLRTWPEPQTTTQVRAFLGVLNYVREYLPLLDRVLAPLHELTGAPKRTALQLTPKQRTAYQEARELAANAVGLYFPDPRWPLTVGTDASDTGIGAVLYQVDDCGRRRFLSFAAKALTPTQRNYPITQREMLAVVFAVKRFHDFVHGRRFTVLTDHAALLWWQTKEELTPMLARWYTILQQYNFGVEHCPGVLHLLPDQLSRLATQITAHRVATTASHCSGPVPTTVRVFLRDPTMPVPRRAHKNDAGWDLLAAKALTIAAGDRAPVRTGVHIETPHGCYLRLAPRSGLAARGIDVVAGVVDAGYRGELLVLLANNSRGPFHVHRLQAVAQAIFEAVAPVDHLVTVRRLDDLSESSRGVNGFGSSDASGPRLNAVTVCSATTGNAPSPLRTEILRQVHSLGHFRAATLAAAVRADGYEWSDLDRDCEQLVAACRACQLQTAKRAQYSPLVPITAVRPMDHVAMDLAGPLTVTEAGNTYILVMVDVFTRFTFLAPLRNKTAASIALALIPIGCMFGFPTIIQSDNGTEFVNRVFEFLTKATGTDHRTTTPYNPSANGLAERAVQRVKRTLSKLALGAISEWDMHLPIVMFQCNASVHRGIGMAPATAMFGRDIRSPMALKRAMSDLTNELSLQTLSRFRNVIIHPEVARNLSAYQAKMTLAFGRMHKPAELAQGDRVVLLGRATG
ncbi:MAG: dUTP diphosphatase, partial [Actinomycetes bacterium]